MVVLVATGGTEAMVLDLHGRRQAFAPGEPLVLVTMPFHNSLPAALEALARLQQDGARGRVIHVRSGNDPAAIGRVREAVEDLEVRQRLFATRIGQVGVPSDWLVASAQTAGTVRESWGPTLVPVDIGAAVQRFHAVSTTDATPLAHDLARRALRLVEPSSEHVLTAARLLPALRRLIDEERLDAITVRCFDLLTTIHTSGCVALAELNDSGIVAGCEGDVPSAITMLWVRYLLDSAAWMANPSDIDAEAGSIRLAHCTIARSLTNGFELRSHFESGIGVGIAAQIDPGPVTLVRIGGRTLRELFVTNGQAESTQAHQDACRTQVSVKVEPACAARVLLHPLGNHLILTPGHHAERLLSWWKFLIEPTA